MNGEAPNHGVEDNFVPLAKREVMERTLAPAGECAHGFEWAVCGQVPPDVRADPPFAEGMLTEDGGEEDGHVTHSGGRVSSGHGVLCVCLPARAMRCPAPEGEDSGRWSRSVWLRRRRGRRVGILSGRGALPGAIIDSSLSE